MAKDDIKKAKAENAERIANIAYSGGGHIGQDDLETAFENGVDWCINSVWNSNNVTPGYDCHVLIEDIYGNVYDDKYDADYNEYESAIEQKEIKRWAYIKDLIPTED